MPVRAHIALSVVALLGLTAAAPAAVSTAPRAPDLLFDTPSLTRVAPGTTLSYRFVRRTSDTAQLGPSFDDTITLTLRPGSRAETRLVTGDVFTGERRRSAGPYPDMTGNPVVVLFLEQDLLELSRVLHGNPRYLRNRLRSALDEAGSEPARIDFDGHEVDGWKISLTPFSDDPNRGRFGAFAGTRYDFVLSDAVPGEIYELRITVPQANGAGPALLDERLTFAAARP